MRLRSHSVKGGNFLAPGAVVANGAPAQRGDAEEAKMRGEATGQGHQMVNTNHFAQLCGFLANGSLAGPLPGPSGAREGSRWEDSTQGRGAPTGQASNMAAPQRAHEHSFGMAMIHAPRRGAGHLGPTPVGALRRRSFAPATFMRAFSADFPADLHSTGNSGEPLCVPLRLCVKGSASPTAWVRINQTPRRGMDSRSWRPALLLNNQPARHTPIPHA